MRYLYLYPSLSVALSTTLWNTHIVSVFLFFPPFVAFSFAFSISVTVSVWVCLRVCVIYIISLLQKFTLIVGTIFWHFGFTTLRAVCVAVAVDVVVVDAVFWQLLRSRSAVCEVGLSLSHSPPVCLSSPPHPQIPFQQPTAHFTSSAFGNMCAFRLSVCPFLFSFLSSLSCFY